MLYGVCIFKMVIIDYVKIFCMFLFKNGYNINYRVFFFLIKMIFDYGDVYGVYNIIIGI